jgi:hypothetical protein
MKVRTYRDSTNYIVSGIQRTWQSKRDEIWFSWSLIESIEQYAPSCRRASQIHLEIYIR